MFTKLLKYEFKAVGKTLGILSIAALIAGGIGGLLMQVMLNNIEVESGAMLSVLSLLLIGGIYLGLMAYTVGSAIMLYYRFYKNKFTDEGYLTFTLPVNTHQILLSTMLNNLIWSAITTVVLFASIGLIILPVFFIEEVKSSMADFPYAFQAMMEEMGSIMPNTWEYLIMCIGSLIYSSVLPLFSITIGSIVAKKYKVLVAIGIGYGISMAVSVLSSFLTIAEMAVTTQLYTDFNNISAASLLPSLLMLLLGIGGYFLMHHLIDKKMNL